MPTQNPAPSQAAEDRDGPGFADASKGGPVRSDSPLRAEATRLESLVHHTESIQAGAPLEQAQRKFQSTNVDFMAVLDGDKVIGLCSRGQIGFVMGSRFGFALYAQSRVGQTMVSKPLVLTQGIAVRVALDVALVRPGEAFHEDVLLVGPDQRLIGLIPVQALAQLQSRIVSDQLDELHRQHETLRIQNVQLFDANRALRQSEGLYLGLFESQTLGVALINLEGVIHDHNRRLAELLNISLDPGMPLGLADLVVPAEREKFLAMLTHQAGKAAGTTAEFRMGIPERGPRIFRFAFGWIQETGQICACVDDVTEQRALEQHIMQQEKQRLLDTLVGGIAHELNNKLTPVQGFSELLMLETAGNARHYSELISKSVQEAAHIIGQLLQLSKPAKQAMTPLDLRSVVEETLVMLRFQLRELDCRVEQHLAAEPVWVFGNVAQLKQVTLNLMLNALQAMQGREGSVLAVTVRERDRKARLEVADNGEGIMPENLVRVFDPFFTTKGSTNGTGLGLSICFSLVREHQGDIAVESKPGHGATFSITLPLHREALPASPRPDTRVPGWAVQTERPRSVRVLVVDDEIVLRSFMQEALSNYFGCQVDTAANGVEALVALGQTDYGLVISDVRMPKMSGLELYEHVLRVQPEMAPRFVFATGHPGTAGANVDAVPRDVPVLNKPFTISRLAEVCSPFLEHARQP